MSSLLVVSALLLPAGLAAAPSVARPRAAEGRALQKPHLSDVPVRWMPGEVLLQLRKDAPPAAAARTLAAAGLSLGERVRGAGARVVRLRRGLGVPAALAQLRSNPLVAHAEPNLLRFPLAPQPRDEFFDQLWGLHNVGQNHGTSNSTRTDARGTPDADIDALEAWETQLGSDETVIAIIDSGVDVSHPDLDGNIWTNPGEIAGNGFDDDGNGYRDDVNGWDFAENDNGLLEQDRSILGFDHGTHVAGIAAAEQDNDTGITGVCPRCKIMVLKVGEPVDSDGDGREDLMGIGLDAEIEAIEYAMSMGADVVNASFGAPIVWSKLEWKAFQRLGRQDVPAVVAAGNLNGDNDMLLLLDFDGDEFPDSVSPVYPASYNLENIVSVAASNHNDEYGFVTDCQLEEPEFPCTFTNWGRFSVDLAAPGVDVLSTVPGGGYSFFDGTSMAAPHVAGVAGLVASQRDLGAGDMRRLLAGTVDTPSSLRTLRTFPRSLFPESPATGDFTSTSGRLNADAAVDVPGDVLFPPTFEGDANIAGARRIRRARSGDAAWPEDVNDVYRKRLRKGRAYKVVLNGADGEDFDLYAWKPKTKEIWQLEEGCFGFPGGCKLAAAPSATESPDERLRFKATRTGTYYFQVSVFLFSEGPYTLKIKRI